MAAVAGETRGESGEILPLDRYIRAVTVCNNLALLASQGSVAQFLQRVALLVRLQRYWTKGYDTVEMSCAEVDAMPPDDDDDAEAALVPVSGAEDWEERSDSTVDMKPDVSGVLSDDDAASRSASVDNICDNESTKAADHGRSQKKQVSKAATAKQQKQIFTCRHCGEVFKYRSLLARHESRIHKQSSATAATTSSASEQHADGEAYTVDGVLKSVTSRHTAVHMAAASACKIKHEDSAAGGDADTAAAGEKKRKANITCSTCGKCFTKPSGLSRHEKTHDVRKSKHVDRSCAVCGETFAFRSLLELHVKRSHDAAVVSAAVAARDVDQGDGETAGRPRCMCSVCGRQFKTKWCLDSHMLTHSGEKPFTCRLPGCSKSFAQSSTRAFHERTHSDAEPYVCSVCGRGFKHRSLLAIHSRMHAGILPYTCLDCPRAFNTLSQLRVHTRIHSGERPYHCAQCPKTFNNATGLRRHERAIHLGERPFKCSVCDKRFTQPSNMRIHMRTHTGERPFPCQFCDQRFAYASSLSGHLRAAHSQNVSLPLSLSQPTM